MAKQKTVFVCNSCGATSAKWYGRCPSCSAWNTLVEEVIVEDKPQHQRLSSGKTAKPIPLEGGGDEVIDRIKLGLDELDEVLGGGLVPGSSVLLGGEPGIGKSTLLLQAAKALADRGGAVLYISGEESLEQVRMRAKRLGALSPDIYLLAECNLEAALAEAAKLPVKLLILDSVQAVFLPDITSAPGSVSQVRAVAAAVLEYARQSGVTVVLVGHVTKEGTLAGPRVLEHMVDTVLYFEGERYTVFRLLRAVKNRFGSTNEIGVFEMGEKGLLSFANPSLFFWGDKEENIPGSAITCVMQGSRPMLLEVQALVAPTSFGNPRRLASGLDYNRMLIIIAVLERKLGLPLGSMDVYLNIAGGFRIDDPAADLAIAAAIASSLKEKALPDKVVLMGEIGLLGELRSTAQLDRRVKETAGFGFNEAVLPKNKMEKPQPLKLLAAANLKDAFTILNLS